MVDRPGGPSWAVETTIEMCEEGLEVEAKEKFLFHGMMLSL